MICLDKTIGYSLRIINGEMKPSKNIGVNNFLGTMHDFYFRGIGNRKFSIEHIGLAQLTYQEAINNFYIKKVNNDKTISKHFEKLSQHVHIADCLKSFNPDTLAWYINKNGEEAKFTDCIKGLVYKEDLTKGTKVFDNSQENSASTSRIQIVEDALNSAISLYGTELIKNNCVDNLLDLNQQLETERDMVQIRLNELMSKTFDNINENGEIDNQLNGLEQ